MANISNYMDELMSATYGDEVRTAIQNAIIAVNADAEAALSQLSTDWDYNNALIMKTNLSENENLNDYYLESGMYYIGGHEVVNAPAPEQTYSILVVLARGTGFAVQLWFHPSSSGINDVFYRVRSGSPVRWLRWQNIPAGLNTLSYRKMLSSEDDLNDYWAENGIYYISSSLPTNSPAAYDGYDPMYAYLLVLHYSDSGVVAQVLIRASAGAIWTRIRNSSGVWQDWFMMGRHCYRPGNTIALSNYGAQGWVSSSAKTAYFFINTLEGLGQVTPTLTVAKVNMRGTGGYIYTYDAAGVNLLDTNTFTLSYKKTAPNQVRVAVTKVDGTAWAATNNTPIIADIITGTLSFT